MAYYSQPKKKTTEYPMHRDAKILNKKLANQIQE
jgi:hypothetical protein